MVSAKIKRIRRILTRIIAILFLSKNIEAKALPSGSAQTIEIHQLNVGQADGGESPPFGTCFVKIDTINIIIDAGNQNAGNSIIIPYLNSLGINKIHLTIGSHHHADHIGGLDEVINQLNPTLCYDRGETYNSTQFNEYVLSAGPRRRTPAVAETLINVSTQNGKVYLICYAVSGLLKNYGFGGESPPFGTGTSDENTLSIALLLQFITNTLDTFKFFTGGDIYARQESLLVSYNSELENVNLIKISHHGSRSSTSQTLLDKMKPLAVFISCGDNNPYGHPHQETLDKLQNTQSIKFIYQTNKGARTTTKSIIAGNIIAKVFSHFFTISTSNFPSRIDSFFFSKDNTLNTEPEPFSRRENKKERKMTIKTTTWDDYTYLDIFIPNEMIQKIQIYNTLGQLVHENEILSYQSFTLKIPNTASGVYLVLIKTNRGESPPFGTGTYYEKITIYK